MGDLSPFTLLLLSFGVIALGLIVFFAYNLSQPKITRKARMIGKNRRSGSSTATCTFEFEDGSQQYYDVSLDTYDALAVGDVGELSTRGLIFRGFRREGDPAPGGRPHGATIPEDDLPQIREALFRGNKIEAIRLYRNCTGSGLAEAKVAVERLEAELRAAEPDRFD